MSRPLTPPLIGKSTLDALEAEPHGEASDRLTDSDSDMDDPETLTTKYLDFKRRLYDLRPDLAATLRGTAAKSLKRANSKAYSKDSDTRIAKLQRKLAEIESDILFDHDEAESQWVETQKRLVKETSERKRLQLGDSIPQIPNPSMAPLGASLTADSGDCGAYADDVGVDMLADLFAGTDVGTYDSSLQDAGPDDKMITIREFGRFSGLKPRRVLEEACKAR